MRKSRQAGAMLLLVASAFRAHAVDPPGEECWRATFTEQLSGPVRELRTTGAASGGPSGYINSYDGDFKWVGKPTATTIASEYVFCFSDSLDSGGKLLVNGKWIALDRIGSIRRPPLAVEGAMSSYTSTRHVRDYPALYGIFSTPGKPDSSLEIQLDPLRGTATVAAGSKANGKRTVSYMRGTAVRTTPP
jgi:hypothetical protein